MNVFGNPQTPPKLHSDSKLPLHLSLASFSQRTRQWLMSEVHLRQQKLTRFSNIDFCRLEIPHSQGADSSEDSMDRETERHRIDQRVVFNAERWRKHRGIDQPAVPFVFRFLFFNIIKGLLALIWQSCGNHLAIICCAAPCLAGVTCCLR